MPLALSWSTYQPVFSSQSFQPRTSASAAALRIASCWALSSLPKASLFTTTMFFGSQALVS